MLHSTARPNDWRHWNEALGSPAVDHFSGYKYASSALAYQASLEGQGVAMAQLELIGDELAAGNLIRPLPDVLDMGDFTYYLVYSHNRTRNPSLRSFCSWLDTELAAAKELGAA